MERKLIFRISKGEEIISSILAFCDKENIKGAWIYGLGAVKSATLSTYDLNTKQYIKNKVEGDFELLNLTGNVGILNNKTVTHLHCVLAEANMKT